MPSYHFPADGRGSARATVLRPGMGDLRYLSLERILLSPTQSEALITSAVCESVLVVLSGVVTVEVRSRSGAATWEEIGGRQSPFDGPPTMGYVPRQSEAAISLNSQAAELIMVSAPSEKDQPPVLLRPDEVNAKVVGQGNWQRTVYTGVGENVAAQRLIVGETISPPGNWSSAPPHKHDTQSASEAVMEEVYHYRLNPSQGFALQRLYTPPEAEDPLEATYAVRDGDTVAIPRGYHPVVAAPGYQLYYLWALAGDDRRYGAWSDDPDHSWIKGVGG